MASLDPSMQSSIRNRPATGGGTASRYRGPRHRWSASAAGGRRVSAILVGHYVVIIIIIICQTWTGASAQFLPSGYESPTEETNCWEPCKFEPDTNTAVPRTECKQFYVCRNGRVTNKLMCSDGRAFDASIGACNHANLVDCQDPTCPPTDFPTVSPTENPTVSPSVSPTVSPTKSPTTSPTTSPTESPSDSPTVSPTISPQFATMHIRSKRALVEEHVLKSYAAGDGSTSSHPSVRYTFDGLMAGLAAMGDVDFGDGIEFFLFDRHWEKFVYGLINVAAFLSQAMAEGIYDDTCDELNWQQVAG